MNARKAEREGATRVTAAFLLFSFVTFASLLVSAPASAAAPFPSKPIQIVVPYQPGGPSDVAPRIMTRKLSALLGQSVVVVNKPGGGAAIGIQSVLSASPDGYSVLSGELSIVTLPFVSKNVGYTLKDLIPFHVPTSAPLSLIVKKDAPWKTMEDLVADARKNPGKLYSTAGPGSIARFTGELFQMATHTQLAHVPMNGAPPAVTAVLGGHVSMSFIGFQAIRSFVEDGSLRALAVMYNKRLKQHPDIPTAAEKGYPRIQSAVWTANFVPAKTPPEVVKKLANAFNTAMKDKEVVDLCEKAGFVLENMSQEESIRFIAEEERKWGEVAKAANILPK